MVPNSGPPADTEISVGSRRPFKQDGVLAMKRAIAAMAVVVSIGVAAASWFILFGMYHIGVDTPHWDITRKLIEVVRDRSIAARTRNVEVPDLRDEQLVLK